jgi:hypothetical protein
MNGFVECFSRLFLMFFVLVYVVFSHKPLPPGQTKGKMPTKVTEFLKRPASSSQRPVGNSHTCEMLTSLESFVDEDNNFCFQDVLRMLAIRMHQFV